jgi:SAM-dependent methyltransferase
MGASNKRPPQINSARDIYRVKRRAGIKKAIGGLDYGRSVEYPTVLDRLDLARATRVLEVGSSKLFLAPYIATRYPVEVHATDQAPAVWLQQRWITALGRADLLESGRYVVAREDATALSYPDETFDRVVCISTIEHVRDVERAARELGRILRPGGLAGVTVPFSKSAREVYVNRGVYGRPYSGTPQFYEYVFDCSSLEQRVIKPSGLEVRSLTFLGEPGVKLSRFVYAPGIGHVLSLFRWIWPWAAHRFLKPIEEHAITEGTENIAVLILAKPLDTAAAASRPRPR